MTKLKEKILKDKLNQIRKESIGIKPELKDKFFALRAQGYSLPHSIEIISKQEKVKELQNDLSFLYRGLKKNKKGE
jgi:hypothetical protein